MLPNKRLTCVFLHRQATRTGKSLASWGMVAACLLMAAGSPRACGGPFEVSLSGVPSEVVPGQSLDLTVTFTIAPKHYLYANQTSVTPAGAPGLSFGKVKAPAGTRKQDPYIGAVVVYKTSVVFMLPVLVARDIQPGRRTLVVAVTYQGCTDTTCFPPQKRELKAEIVVADAKAAQPNADEAPRAPAQSARPAFCEVSARVVPEQVAPGSSLTIRIRLKISAKHYLYADKASVQASPTPGITFGQLKAPKGVRRDVPYVGAKIVYEREAVFELPALVQKTTELGPKRVSLAATYEGCSDVSCYPAQTQTVDAAFVVVALGVPVAAGAPVAKTPAHGEVAKRELEMPAKRETNVFQETAERFGLLGMLAMAFVWGIGASLTPCVYPMIPITVTVIGASSSGSVLRAFLMSLVYVLGMSITYAAFGVVAAWSGGLFGAYAQHPAVRIVVAGVFGLLALSMFDVFYIQMPTSISSRLAGSKGAGVVGVCLTGAAAGAAVGPCVGPLLVALLVYIAGIGNPVLGFLTMWSFALGMGVLFLVVGTASGAAVSLPKAGPWMSKIKHVFGLFLLGFALYYVRPVVPEAVFLVLLGGVLIGAGVFVGALDPMAAESTGRDRAWKVIGIVCLTLGVCYAARSVLRVQPPRAGAGPTPAHSGIQWLKGEADALARAGQEHMPIILDFRADWCSACLMLERETFVDSRVIAESKRFVCTTIDCTDTKAASLSEVQNKYRVVGLPTLAFIDSRGQFLQDKSITQFVRPDALLARMRQVR